jgi:hypothetical protein
MASIAQLFVSHQPFEMIDGVHMVPCQSSLKKALYTIVASDEAELNDHILKIQQLVGDYVRNIPK